MFCNFLGSSVEFKQSGPKSLELPPPHACILKGIMCWEVAKVEWYEKRSRSR